MVRLLLQRESSSSLEAPLKGIPLRYEASRGVDAPSRGGALCGVNGCRGPEEPLRDDKGFFLGLSSELRGEREEETSPLRKGEGLLPSLRQGEGAQERARKGSSRREEGDPRGKGRPREGSAERLAKGPGPSRSETLEEREEAPLKASSRGASEEETKRRVDDGRTGEGPEPSRSEVKVESSSKVSSQGRRTVDERAGEASAAGAGGLKRDSRGPAAVAFEALAATENYPLPISELLPIEEVSGSRPKRGDEEDRERVVSKASRREDLLRDIEALEQLISLGPREMKTLLDRVVGNGFKEFLCDAETKLPSYEGAASYLGAKGSVAQQGRYHRAPDGILSDLERGGRRGIWLLEAMLIAASALAILFLTKGGEGAKGPKLLGDLHDLLQDAEEDFDLGEECLFALLPSFLGFPLAVRASTRQRRDSGEHKKLAEVAGALAKEAIKLQELARQSEEKALENVLTNLVGFCKNLQTAEEGSEGDGLLLQRKDEQTEFFLDILTKRKGPTVPIGNLLGKTFLEQRDLAAAARPICLFVGAFLKDPPKSRLEDSASCNFVERPYFLEGSQIAYVEDAPHAIAAAILLQTVRSDGCKEQEYLRKTYGRGGTGRLKLAPRGLCFRLYAEIRDLKAQREEVKKCSKSAGCRLTQS